MGILEEGREYLFSDDCINWVRRILGRVLDDNHELHPYIYRTYAKDVGFKFIKPLEKPERKLYTQSMKDAGKPIKVGMWFKNSFSDEVECTLAPDSKGKIAYSYNQESYFTVPKGITPFPDPVKLIDGEAYEFIYKNRKIKGICGSNKYFYTPKESFNSEECTNIKPLSCTPV